MKKDAAYRTALAGILCAQAIALSFLEGLLPAFPFLPPGAKPGFSNIINMFTAGFVGLTEALSVCVAKALFAFITRGVTAGVMSLCGGVASTLVMWILLRHFSGKLGLAGISVICAACHNAAQLAVAAVITGTPSIMYYAPFLAAFSGVSGIVIGVIMKAVMPALQKQSRFFIKK